MRIYWLNGSLTIEPENKREFGLLTELSENLKFGPAELASTGRELLSGGQNLPGCLVGNHEVIPSAICSDFLNEQPVVPVHEPKKILRYIERGSRIP